MSFLDRFNRPVSDGAQLASAAPAPPATHEILLELGDFLPQIPPELVRAGPHPAEARLKFDMADLADRIASGQTSIRLAELHRQVPEIFQADAPLPGDLEIPFPWDKVMKMLADARSTAARLPRAGGPTPTGAESSGNRRALGAALQPALLHDEKLTREEILRACDGLSAELERVKSEHERQLAALAAESGQRGPKPGSATQPHKDAARAASPAGLERSPKEHQRQVDELQRRISALESHQREAAHELSREKESRIKLERQHGALDRLSRETTKHHEDAAAALKRDFETTTRKRDAEAARALREAHEQFESLKAAKARIAAELEEVRARLAKAPPAGEAWEGRAVAQFEADLENYRRRIRELLAERDALVSEKEALAAGSSAAAVADDEALRAERTQLSRELEAARLSSNAMITNLRAENKRLTYEREATQKEEQTALAEMTAERDGWEARTKALQAEITRVRQQHEISVADLRATLAGVQRGGEKQAEESAAARQEREQALAAVTGERDAALATLATLAAERGQVRQGAAEAEQKLSAEVSRLSTALEVARREAASSAQRLATATAEASRKCEVAQRECETLRAELEKLREEQRHTYGEVSAEDCGNALPPGTGPTLREVRPEQQASVREIHATELLPPPAEHAGWLKIPRIRPVPVPPPHLQNH